MTVWMTVYVLVWPLLVAGVLAVIAKAFFGEWREARRDNRSML